MNRIALLGLLSFLGACGDEGSSDHDQIQISNGSGAEAGLLVDGDRFVSKAATLDVGARSGAGEVWAFTVGRSPRLLPAVQWTDGPDTIAVEFLPPVRIPVTAWIVKGPFAEQRDRALRAQVRTQEIWSAERMGVEFSEFQVLDATANPRAAAHYAFQDGAADAWKSLRQDIGFVEGRINVYWVESVDAIQTMGISNFNATVVMGGKTGADLLSHELGHAFGLTHVNADPNFNQENVMHNASSVRRYLTEGQIFRAHFNPDSTLNKLYGAHLTETLRFCGYSEASAACPAIHERVWADGAFAPNQPAALASGPGDCALAED